MKKDDALPKGIAGRLVSVAPMMGCTDRHARYFLRLISRHTWLYTEMVTTGAILHGDRARLLGFDSFEHPVALQVGGSDPKALSHSAKVGEGFGYDEINLNLGCPSSRVQSGWFGACLMADPDLVAQCVAAMQHSVRVPVTVKLRIGIDDRDAYGDLARFVEAVAGAGCRTFIVHARKAWLQGLSPKENREVPPLQYDRVYRLKQDFPHLEIILNGGVKTPGDVRGHLGGVDGVMMGREAYANPYVLAEVDRAFYGDNEPIPTRHEILDRYLGYVDAQLKCGVRLSQISKHLVGLFLGLPGARAWRRHVSEQACKAGAGAEVLRDAAQYVHP